MNFFLSSASSFEWEGAVLELETEDQSVGSALRSVGIPVTSKWAGGIRIVRFRATNLLPHIQNTDADLTILFFSLDERPMKHIASERERKISWLRY
jgi:hypothetical protein